MWREEEYPSEEDRDFEEEEFQEHAPIKPVPRPPAAVHPRTATPAPRPARRPATQPPAATMPTPPTPVPPSHYQPAIHAVAAAAAATAAAAAAAAADPFAAQRPSAAATASARAPVATAAPTPAPVPLSAAPVVGLDDSPRSGVTARVIAVLACLLFAAGGGFALFRAKDTKAVTRPLADAFTVKDLKLLLVPEVIFGDETNHGLAVVEGTLVNDVEGAAYSHITVRARILDSTGRAIAESTRPAGTKLKDAELRAMGAKVKGLPAAERGTRFDELLAAAYPLEGRTVPNAGVAHFQIIDFQVVFLEAPSGCCADHRAVAEVVAADLDSPPAPK